MQTQNNADVKKSNGPSFFIYATQRLALAVLIIVAVVGGVAYTLHYYNITPIVESMPADEEQPEHAMDTANPAHEYADADSGAQTAEMAQRAEEKPTAAPSNATPLQPHLPMTADKPTMAPDMPEPEPKAQVATQAPQAPAAVTPHQTPQTPAVATPHQAPQAPAVVTPHQAPQTPAFVTPRQAAQPPVYHTRPAPPHPPESHPVPAPVNQQPPPQAPEQKHIQRPIGVAFVEALMQPIDYELNQRFWGWRPNDIINPTDNVNNFQFGVLEVTRRTTVQLTERISRTGSTDAFNQHLQNAMNWFMVKADRYWFPSPESKYKESLKELGTYKLQLTNGKATFYTRTDNLIPLLMAFEDLLGSCDENLVKHTEVDGSEVSTFKADDYFYYAQGVASTMIVILEAIHHDFAHTLESRNGSDLLHHAVISCKIAAELDPWFITNSDLDGLFANHRANMAAPISHARFYIGQLIKTLST